MKRALEAHSTLMLALSNVLVTRKIKNHPNKSAIEACITSLRKNLMLKDDSNFQSAMKIVENDFATLEISKLFER